MLKPTRKILMNPCSHSWTPTWFPLDHRGSPSGPRSSEVTRDPKSMASGAGGVPVGLRQVWTLWRVPTVGRSGPRRPPKKGREERRGARGS